MSGNGTGNLGGREFRFFFAFGSHVPAAHIFSFSGRFSGQFSELDRLLIELDAPFSATSTDRSRFLPNG
jgi:hypothetical protein